MGNIASQFSDAPYADYICLGPWCVKRQYLDGGGRGIFTHLRHVPGLRKRMILSLWNAARFDPSLCESLPYGYDAVQKSADGFRARGFFIDGGRTVKTVDKNSRYGLNTKHELDIRAGILKQSGLNIPRVVTSRENDEYIQIEEEFVAGRIYSHWRDCALYETQISAPLQRLAQRQGIGRKPLCETIDAAIRDVILQSDCGLSAVMRGRALLLSNPIVATGFSHGDLVSSNMIVSGGKLYAVNWERAAERYAGYDQVRLALKHPSNRVYRRCAAQVFERFQQGAMSLADAQTIRLAANAAREACKKAG